jgi:hypothetical protein
MNDGANVASLRAQVEACSFAAFSRRAGECGSGTATMSHSGKTVQIAILGMGAVGTTTCITLIRELLARKGAPAVEIHTFEKTSSIGAGLAYGTKHDFHVLNMRAWTMSPVS